MARKLWQGLTAEAFLADYWQKKPLLIRGAFPGFRDFVSPAQLREWAARDDVLARLVVERAGRWTVHHAPLSARAFRGLKGSHWSLLVQGVDQLMAAGKALLARFDFIPHARLDDLMVSFAPAGGGVGPHFDSYDVFLLQGLGHKRWQVSSQDDRALLPDAPLRLLCRFTPEQEWVLGPGDMLYLPPRLAHYGVALDDCLTYSIGFRAPTAQELAGRFLDHLQEVLHLPGMYADPDLRVQRHPAEIGAGMVAQVETMLAGIRWDRSEVERFLGRYLTEPKPHVFFDPPSRPLPLGRFAGAAARRGVVLALKSQMLFCGRDFYLNGEHVVPPRGTRAALMVLADRRRLDLPANPPDALLRLLHAWYRAGYVTLGARA